MKKKYLALYIIIPTIIVIALLYIFLKLKINSEINKANKLLSLQISEISSELKFLRNLSMIKNGMKYFASNAVEKIISEFIHTRPELNLMAIYVIDKRGELFSSTTLKQNNLILPWVKNNINSILDAANNSDGQFANYGIYNEDRSILVYKSLVKKNNKELGKIVFIVDLLKMKKKILSDVNLLNIDIRNKKETFNTNYIENNEFRGISIGITSVVKEYWQELMEIFWIAIIVFVALIMAAILIMKRNYPKNISQFFISSENFNLSAQTIEKIIKELDEVSKNDLAKYLQILHSNSRIINNYRTIKYN